MRETDFATSREYCSVCRKLIPALERRYYVDGIAVCIQCFYHNSHFGNPATGWNTRPLEDALTAQLAERDRRIQELEADQTISDLMGLALLGYLEHGGGKSWAVLEESAKAWKVGYLKRIAEG